jgi:hypothetical protein
MMAIKLIINNNIIDIKSELINIYKQNTVLIEFVICYIIIFFIMLPFFMETLIKAGV